jgi:hypothetical protein
MVYYRPYGSDEMKFGLSELVMRWMSRWQGREIG